jgi:uncharacterized secreted protein with C-terminal beta-propeller domain
VFKETTGDSLMDTQSVFRFSHLLVIGLVLVNCSGSDDTSTPIEQITEVPIILEARPIEGPLANKSQTAVSRFIKNGIYSAARNQSFIALEDAVVAPSASSTDFSTTNTQEVGVDEADRIEYDGNFLYVSELPQWTGEQNDNGKVRILRRNEDYSLTEVNRLDAQDQSFVNHGMYLYEDTLAVIAVNQQVYTIDIMPGDYYLPENSQVNLMIYNTTEPSQATNTLSLTIDGNLLSSRRIDEYIYLVMTYVPSVAELQLNASTDEAALSNYKKIIATPDQDLMPKMHLNGNAIAMNNMGDCVIPSNASVQDGLAQIVTVLRINMQQTNDIQSSCLSSYTNLLYMSQNNLYLTSNLATETNLHKLSLDDLSYQASGKVNGVIGWRGPGQLRLSEKDGYLRIVTSDYQNSDPHHQLHVLNQQANLLVEVATLPNDNQPAPLGKAGEDIYAVRFVGNKAYIVTYQRIDPLYVIDLSVADAPFVAGSLEIPGFSSYLYPISDHLLLGIGQQVSQVAIPQSGQEPTIVPVQDGMKVSLFDVQDPAFPIELASVLRQDAYTPVEYDYRALSALTIGSEIHFALPYEQWSQNDVDFYWQAQNNLLMLNVDMNTNQLSEVNDLSPPKDTNYYFYTGEDRSVLHGQHVYYLRGNQVWHSLWQGVGPLSGPY